MCLPFSLTAPRRNGDNFSILRFARGRKAASHSRHRLGIAGRRERPAGSSSAALQCLADAGGGYSLKTDPTGIIIMAIGRKYCGVREMSMRRNSRGAPKTPIKSKRAIPENRSEAKSHSNIQAINRCDKVRMEGVEPTHLAAPDPKSGVSTSSTTSAGGVQI